MSEMEQAQLLVEEIELTPMGSKGELVAGGRAAEARGPAPFYIRYGLFLITVVAPVAAAAIYFFFFAAPLYYSEAHFIVRSSASSNNGGGVAAVIENQGLSRANDETYAVDDYITSRDVVDLLVRNDNLRAILARPEADFINRHPNFYTIDNKENLYRRFQYMVDARIDPATGISTLQVAAFRADDARAVAGAILKYAEALINRLNERAFDDAESYAQSIVDKERAHIEELEADFTQYRNVRGTVDPGKEALASYEMVGKMATELALLQADLRQQSAMAPADPNLPSMRERIRSYQAEIDRQKLGIVGNDKSLAAKLGGFERLEMERELAGRALGIAMVSLAKAREDARQQHLYLQTIVEPNLNDEPSRWGPILGMGIVLLISLAVFSIARALGSITLEHTA